MRKIAIKSIDSNEWIGGLYYKKNIAFGLSQAYKDEPTEIHIVVGNNGNVFKNIGDVKVYEIKQCNRKLMNLKFLLYLKLHGIRYLYPASGKIKLKDLCQIAWIPDFQHIHYPQYQEKENLKLREDEYSRIGRSDCPIVLSSNDAANDFRRYRPSLRNVYVVHFVSFIEPEIRTITKRDEEYILNKYDLQPQNFICISNQFWQHKNHIVVLKAIELLAEIKPDFNFKFVFTGEPKDFRNPDYYNQLMELFNKEEIKSRTKILGFIDRIDQLAIMKNSKYIIQPSLFEGWGTVVEDAKVLDKLILLSDIPVHHEQMNENCVLFDPRNPEELALKIVEMSKTDHSDDVEKGIKDMYVRAREYSKSFQQMLEDLDSPK